VELHDIAEIFAAMGDITRVRIIQTLMAGDKSVGELAEQLDVSISAISHQLRRLKDLKILRYHKEGKRVFYGLDDAHIAGLYQMALDHVKHKR
jgi:ArsR family transcriptional regulator